MCFKKKKKSDVHKYNTRNRNDMPLQSGSSKTEIKLIKMYNKLPGRVKENFKSDLKKLLHEKNSYSFDEFFNVVL